MFDFFINIGGMILWGGSLMDLLKELYFFISEGIWNKL